jgi:hypothetical protein
VTAEGAAVLGEEEAAKTNVENALSSSSATGDEVTVTKVLPREPPRSRLSDQVAREEQKGRCNHRPAVSNAAKGRATPKQRGELLATVMAANARRSRGQRRVGVPMGRGKTSPSLRSTWRVRRMPVDFGLRLD